MWEIGTIHRGAWAQRHWSSSGCLFHHAYPTGYRASKVMFGRTYEMTISQGNSRPLSSRWMPSHRSLQASRDMGGNLCDSGAHLSLCTPIKMHNFTCGFQFFKDMLGCTHMLTIFLGTARMPQPRALQTKNVLRCISAVQENADFGFDPALIGKNLNNPPDMQNACAACSTEIQKRSLWRLGLPSRHPLGLEDAAALRCWCKFLPTCIKSSS